MDKLATEALSKKDFPERVSNTRASFRTEGQTKKAVRGNQTRCSGTRVPTAFFSLIIILMVTGIVFAPARSAHPAEILGSWITGTSHIAETGPQRALIFTAHVENSTNANVTGVTYGGQSMTKIIDHNYAGTATVYVTAFVLDEAGIAAATSSDFSVTWSAAPSETPAYSSVFLQNIYQTALIGATATGGSTASTAETSAVASNWRQYHKHCRNRCGFHQCR